MLISLGLVMVALALSQWLVRPLVLVLTPVLDLSWFAWAALALLLWVFAGVPRGPEER
jgi:hypothetical protein